MFLRIFFEAMIVITMPTKATKTLTRPKIASLDQPKPESLAGWSDWEGGIGEAFAANKKKNKKKGTRRSAWRAMLRLSRAGAVGL